MTDHTIAVLGSTGSVGCQALDVAAALALPVDLIVAGSNVVAAEEEIRRFSPRVCVLHEKHAGDDLRTRVADTATKVFSGDEAITAAIAESRADVFVNAILGKSGLLPTLAVLEAGKRLALANKESLVIAGDLVNRAKEHYGAEMIPVDSEHSAIFQCLANGKKNEVKRILLTASGGPFFGYTKERLKTVTLADTLRHPTWKMGQKITVDSATLMNKGFEVIEAVHLFGVAPADVTVAVHRESIIHSAVEYIDNTLFAEMSVPDMRACVQYAVTYPDRVPAVIEPLDLFRAGTLSFMPPDTDAFPLLQLAYAAIADGGAVPAVLNAADETAVDAFLHGKIPFWKIAGIVSETVDILRQNAITATSLDEILSMDAEGRRVALSRIATA